jgi:hypothetical protein
MKDSQQEIHERVSRGSNEDDYGWRFVGTYRIKTDALFLNPIPRRLFQLFTKEQNF